MVGNNSYYTLYIFCIAGTEVKEAVWPKSGPCSLGMEAWKGLTGSIQTPMPPLAGTPTSLSTQFLELSSAGA